MQERRLNTNWDERYDKRSQELRRTTWNNISVEVRRTTGGKCVLCDRPATCTHHACYFGPYKAGVDLFGLCDDCHAQAHLFKNWRRYRYRGVWKNKNTPDFYKKLRQGWQGKNQN